MTKLNQKINIALIILILTLLKNIFVHPTARGRTNENTPSSHVTRLSLLPRSRT